MYWYRGGLWIPDQVVQWERVLVVGPGDLSSQGGARQGQNLPVVLVPDETRAVLAQLNGAHHLMLELVYGVVASSPWLNPLFG